MYKILQLQQLIPVYYSFNYIKEYDNVIYSLSKDLDGADPENVLKAKEYLDLMIKERLEYQIQLLYNYYIIN